MKTLYAALLGVMLTALLAVGIYSLVDQDATVSMSEKRDLAKKPVFSWGSLADGSYIEQLEKFYSDTFPGREKLLGLNRTMNKFYYYSPGEQNYLAIDLKGGIEQGGEALHDIQALQSGTNPGAAKPAAPAPSKEDSAPDTEPDAAPEDGDKPEDEPEHELPKIDLPDMDEAASIGTIIVIGDNAMDIPTATNEVIDDYAAAVNRLNAALGPDVRTISLVTPNSGEFYSPEDKHTGIHSQKDMIDRCYGGMDESVVTVDAYSALREHADEYIYFRTDHHWTALGAYYAYVKFCEAAGFEPAKLEEFQTGTYTGFLGSMYTFTQGYPQSDVLRENPDTLTYYLPKVETHAKYYSDSTLSDGVPISVVYTKLAEDVQNKYLCFIGGDNPICVIETEVDGPVCMVLKESYGNAFAPFLTSHYSKIVVIDPRKFNQEGMPPLDLKAFAAQEGVDDLLVINYPFMICNSYYIEWLNRLIPGS